MSTIKDSLYFNYNGISSRDFGLIHISTDSGMYEETLVGSRELRETKVAGNDKPYFKGFDSSPREFDMKIAFEEDFTDESLNEVVLWLFQDNYKPLFFEGKEDKLFYCIAVSDSNIVHNGMKQGYITISMRCDSPYVYSNIYTSTEYDLSTNTVAFPITIENKGHFNMFPEISIRKIGVGNITITNVSNSGEIFEIRDLADSEEVYINSEKETIETDIIGVYRYDKVIGNYLELPYGVNIINVIGKCIIQFRYQYKYKF